MPTRPKNEAEFAALACKLADTGEFASAELVRAVLGYWPETLCWWTDDLGAVLERRCSRALGSAPLGARSCRSQLAPQMSVLRRVRANGGYWNP